MAGATCGAGYAHSSGTPDITPVFCGAHVVFFTCVCVCILFYTLCCRSGLDIVFTDEWYYDLKLNV